MVPAGKEGKLKERIPFNDSWLYKPCFASGDTCCTADPAGYAQVDLPHTNKILPYNCFNETECQFISSYKKRFPVKKEWENKTVLLEFEGVMAACDVWCNGVHAGGHEGGFTPFVVDLTNAVKFGEENVLTVRVDSTERKDIPPFGNVVDYLTYGGIYREVWLTAADPVHLSRLFLDCPEPLEEEKTLYCSCEITAPQACGGMVTVTLFSPQGDKAGEQTETLSLKQGSGTYRITLSHLQKIVLWDPDHPNLYTVEAKVKAGDNRDICRERFGFRHARFTPEGFFLNGHKVKLIGLNRHQSWPYAGYAMPRRVQRKDAQLLKEGLGCNMVRTSHYPQSRHFLDACDEMGLLVMEEIPGWQHIGDEAWKERSLMELEEMILRDYNRPSIVLWGVRINESQDDHSFYVRTNALAHRLDPGRQTGGTRYIQRSELLEDVYTYNDFTHDGGKEVFRPQQETTGLERPVPLLVTESNGHMYPTKRFDQEQRLTEHALRHLRVINESLGREDLAGGISWCAFDYHTHASFGSGDKICYHGVFDMFRNPKYAAYAYASQKDPAQQIVMEPVTAASRGEKDGGGMVPFYIMTNCDYVRVYKNGKQVADFYPQKEEFPYLAHPPVMVVHLMEADVLSGFSGEDRQQFQEYLEKRMREGTLTGLRQEDLAYLAALAQKYGLPVKELVTTVIKSAGGWGDVSNNLVLEGFWDGRAVYRREIGEGKYAAGITAKPDDTVLYTGGETYDATRITVEAVDNMGNLMPFIQECVEVKLEGPGRLIGPARFPLTGGISSFWVRTAGETGSVGISIEGMTGRAECTLEVELAVPII